MSSLYSLHKCLKTTYVLFQDNNFDNFLNKIGVAKEARRRAINLKPTIKLTKKEKIYTLTTKYGDGRVSNINFELGKPITQKLKNGGEVTSLFVAKNGQIEEKLSAFGRTINVTRIFTPNMVTVKMTAGKERCERFYTKKSKPDSEDIKSETSRRTVTSSEMSDTTGETFATESEIEIRNII